MQTISKQTLSDTMYYHNQPALTYQIQYPAFTTTCNPTAAQSINALYAKEAKAAEAYCRTVLFPYAVEQVRYLPADSSFFEYQWILTYQITYNQNCITSLYLDQYSYMGGAHGITVRTSDTWDFKNGNRLTLPDFWGVPSLGISRQAALLQAIERKLQEQLLKTPGVFFEDYPILLRQNFRQESFYLVPTGMVFYFQPYDIAPYASGIPEFHLSPQELSLPNPKPIPF